jgi:hypothetical protein
VAGLSASDHGYLAYTILEDLLANMDQFVAAIIVKEQEEIHQLHLSVAKERETIAAMRAGCYSTHFVGITMVVWLRLGAMSDASFFLVRCSTTVLCHYMWLVNYLVMDAPRPFPVTAIGAQQRTKFWDAKGIFADPPQATTKLAIRPPQASLFKMRDLAPFCGGSAELEALLVKE